MEKGFTNLEILIVACVVAALIFGSKLLADQASLFLAIVHRTLGN